MLRLVSIIAAVAIVCLLAGTALLIWSGRGEEVAGCGGVSTLGGDVGGPFELLSETGETVTDADVIDEPTLVYFGYTFCPDVCPLDAARNADALDLLAERGHENVKAAFITIDPERDTADVLAQYTDYLHPDMIGLTGTEEQIEAAGEAYRVYAARRGDDPETYLMDHSTFTYLMLPDTGFATLFRGAPGTSSEGVTAEQVAEGTACVLEAS